MTTRKKKPFFDIHSVGMWASLGTLIVVCFTITANVNGCFESRFTKEERNRIAYEGYLRLDKGDSAIIAMVVNNFWKLYSHIRADSVVCQSRFEDLMDSLHDLRIDLNLKKSR